MARRGHLGRKERELGTLGGQQGAGSAGVRGGEPAWGRPQRCCTKGPSRRAFR